MNNSNMRRLFEATSGGIFKMLLATLLVGSLTGCETLRNMFSGSASIKASTVPMVQITSPHDSESLTSGQTTNFEGKGTDLIDGALPSSSLSWSSSVDGPLGTGNTISAKLSSSTTAPTIHKITLKGVNKAGQEGEQSITVVVAQPAKAKRATKKVTPAPDDKTTTAVRNPN